MPFGARDYVTYMSHIGRDSSDSRSKNCFIQTLILKKNTIFYQLQGPLGLRGPRGKSPVRQCPCYSGSNCFIHANEVNQFNLFKFVHKY